MPSNAMEPEFQVATSVISCLDPRQAAKNDQVDAAASKEKVMYSVEDTLTSKIPDVEPEHILELLVHILNDFLGNLNFVLPDALSLLFAIESLLL
mmetsp:Transcript_6946/g.21172  ORF Transcript_6946/g.21172 Transcript_6946/m.21172 type:complete len:95 (+) Transcript_6946:2852-3136(+)